MTAALDPDTPAGTIVVGVHGDTIGTLTRIYLDNHSQPRWAAVRIGTHTYLMPVTGARAEHDTVVVDYTLTQLSTAPHRDPSAEPSAQVEHDLCRHYGLADATPSGAAAPPPPRRDDDDAPAVTTIRSEEQLHVATEQVRTGTARLVKYTVTEYVTQTVPLTHEEVRVEYGPAPDTDQDSLPDQDQSSQDREPVDDSAPGADGGDEPALTLYAEKLTVHKEWVPVQRMRLGTETVTEHQTVTAQLRTEQIDEPTIDDDRR